MATPAIRAELSVMNIICAMTVAAAAAEARHRGKRLAMAAIATDNVVRAVQRELRLQIVIELPLQPVNRVVARGALVLEATVVRIVFAVTIHTLFWRILEYVRFVTRIAFLAAVLPEQWETCQIVIKKHVFRPRYIIVAVLALDALRAEMRVVFLVTGIASRRQCYFENRFNMARFAREFFMRAMNFMVGIDIVIKNDARPVSGNVAGLTDITEVSIVIVVFEMT